MEQFANWFCLNNRLNFTIDAQIHPSDAQYYFGRDDTKVRLQRQLRSGFVDPGAPKIVVYGPYGSGKTQTLFYLQHYLENDPLIQQVNPSKPHLVYVPVEMQERSKATNLHMQLMQALGKDVIGAWVKKLFDTTQNLDAALSEITTNTNIACALRELRAPGEASFAAWRWITCQGLASKDLSSLQLTADLSMLQSKDMAEALISVGCLARKVGISLIFLIDEMESLQNVRAGDAAESLHHYMRYLSEKKNSYVGFLIGLKADVLDEMSGILRGNDVMSRVGGQNYLELPPLPAISNVKVFMRELLCHLTDQEKVDQRVASLGLASHSGLFPFEDSAFELLADYATQEITKALPRNIINAINECAIMAWDEEKPLIDEAIVNSVGPYVFA